MATARNYDALDFAADERAAARARGEVPTHPDGSHQTIINSDGTSRRVRCSCGHEGASHPATQAAWPTISAEAKAHRAIHARRR